jgi:urea transport system substrate-binding protein
MKKRLKVNVMLLLILSLILSACSGSSSSGDAPASDEEGIKVGVLFSLSGPTAITEKGMANATLLAIKEINENGGINGKKIIPVVEDIESSPSVAAEKIKKVIQQDKVVASIGGYTSSTRQAMLPIVEQYNNLLIYPTLYEGEEYSKNIIYTGATPNQQLQDFVPWLVENVGKKFYFIGNDYIYPVQTDNQVKEMLKLEGGETVGEEYVPLGHSEFSSVINNIRKAKPDVVFSTLVGDSVAAFYSQFKSNGFDSATLPIASPIMAETDIQAMGADVAEGNITSFNYFQTVDTPENEAFVKAYHDEYGENEPITSVMQQAYFSAYLLKEAAEKAGDVSDADKLINSFAGVEFKAPEGVVKVDEKNNHTWLHSRIGRVNSEGQFDILWESDGTIQPEPWSELLFPDQPKPWEQ